MATVSVLLGDQVRATEVNPGSLLGDVIVATGLPLEQPCAGRGTCGKCKVLAEGALDAPDEVEREQLARAELAAGYRLACRAHVMGDVSVTLAPIVVYSNKIFRESDDYRRRDEPLGLAIDLGSTTVAAFLTLLEGGRVCAGSAALNQQTVFGADVISRLAVAGRGRSDADRLSALALSSIVQAIGGLLLSRRILRRVRRVTIVGNCAMHHLLLGYPVDSLMTLPFQPHSTDAVRGGNRLLNDVLAPEAQVNLPPLIGGFVGSDALACLVFFGFDCASEPMAAIDLGTNGEVMVTDGNHILVASTAAGPAFEGVNISCGTRAVDGAVIGAEIDPESGRLELSTLGDQPPVGVTGSGLLSIVHQLVRARVVDHSGRLGQPSPGFPHRIDHDAAGVRRIALTEARADDETLYLTQQDIRELQKAKGAVRAATEILMAQLGLKATDLRRLVLTGSFGSQVDLEAVIGLGMIPRVDLSIVETPANGAGFGAALMLNDDEFERGERIAHQAQQVDLDRDADFNACFLRSLSFPQ
jgi:uncharacterized 2Fe-2S/4Fe-4S cluster protein (DUF4445 family)